MSVWNTKRQRTVTAIAERAGLRNIRFEIGRKHIKMRAVTPLGDAVQTSIANTPSCNRADANLAADIRRMARYRREC
jgi:hypothetical protein